jgi:hypothetical protein
MSPILIIFITFFCVPLKWTSKSTYINSIDLELKQKDSPYTYELIEYKLLEVYYHFICYVVHRGVCFRVAPRLIWSIRLSRTMRGSGWKWQRQKNILIYEILKMNNPKSHTENTSTDMVTRDRWSAFSRIQHIGTIQNLNIDF